MVLSMTDFIDYKSLKLSDVDLHVITIKANGVRQFGTILTHPERQLVRYQFMEIIFRLGVDKHKQLKPSQALKRMFESHFTQVDDCHQWRVKWYWNEECDKVITDNLQQIKDVFGAWSIYLPSEERHLTLKDFC